MKVRRRRKPSSRYCTVLGCHSIKHIDRELNYHSFPKEGASSVKIINKFGVEEKLDRRKAWENALLNGKPATQNMRVCSKHFMKTDYCTSLKGDLCKKPCLKTIAVPTQNLPENELLQKEKPNDELGFEKRNNVTESLAEETSKYIENSFHVNNIKTEVVSEHSEDKTNELDILDKTNRCMDNSFNVDNIKTEKEPEISEDNKNELDVLDKTIRYIENTFNVDNVKTEEVPALRADIKSELDVVNETNEFEFIDVTKINYN